MLSLARSMPSRRILTMSLTEYVEPDIVTPNQAADKDDDLAEPDTSVCWRPRVQAEELARMGKDVDRLDQDEAALREPDRAD